MARRWWTNTTRWSLAALLVATTLSVVGAGPAAGGPTPAQPAPLKLDKPEVLKPVAFGASEAVTEIAKRASARTGVTAARPEERGPAVKDNGFSGEATVAPQASIDVAAPAPSLTFQGITNACGGCSPPDTVGDVGPTHYVQMVNSHFAMWTKAGVLAVATTSIGALFPVGSNCDIGFGDPIVLHDQLANRWILTQFTAAAPFRLCIAVSQTANPTGAYFSYVFDSTNFADYPKYGVWSNGIYGSTREFDVNNVFVGVGAYVFDKNAMYAGAAATALKFLIPPGAAPFRIGDGLLPADLDGTNLPSGGVNSPVPYVGTMDNGGPYAAPADALNLFRFQLVTFAPPNATFTFISQINVAAFDSIFPCAPTSRDCIPQNGTAQKIDILSYRQRPLHRLAYRNFLSYEAMFTNQSVEAAAGIAGIRWWEVRNPLGAAALFQQGTVVGTDGNHRWMGSVAQDKNGNAALAYSISGAALFPGIRYVGRLAGDALNTMPWTEQVLFNGAGSQTGSARWGDYTSMNIDPSDNCTFWYTNEYYAVSSPSTWTTRIGRFRFPNC